MPIYEFKCTNCNKNFEELTKIKKTAKTNCPFCKSNDIEKEIGKSTFLKSCNKSCDSCHSCK